VSSSYGDVLNHLLFHKALEEDRSERIDRYLRMLESVRDGHPFPAEDPFERSVAAAFELVMEQSFDPWDIDLVRFCKAYIHRLRSMGTVNFVTAGRLILLAWSVLKLQTDVLLSNMEPVNPPEEDMFESWDLGAGLYEGPEDVEFTHQLLVEEEPPLREVLQREVQRPVTLLDLLEAFDQAFRETSGAIQAPKARPRRRMDSLRGKVHREDLEEDIRRTWSLIEARGKEVVGLSELCNGDRWEQATVFLSVLFLSRMGWVEVWQDELPCGEVYVKPLQRGPVELETTGMQTAQVA
jgi:segregation and condensation protein A